MVFEHVSDGRGRWASLWLWATLLVLAWGALSFGAVYPWAYWPLLGGSMIVGLLPWLVLGPVRNPFATRWFWLAFPAVTLAVLVQLVPLQWETLRSLSPSTDSFLRQYSVPYTLEVNIRLAGLDGAALGDSGPWHPLSIRPEATWLGLAFFVAFVILFVGCARALSVTGAGSLAGGLVMLGGLLALVGLVQKATFTGKIYGFWQPTYSTGVPFGPFVNRNHFAGWMLMALFVALGYFCASVAGAMRGTKSDWHHRLLWFSSRAASQLVLVSSVVIVMAISLVLTMSRSGIAALATALTLFGWLVAGRFATRARKALAVAFLGLVLAAAVGRTGVDVVSGRFASASWSTMGGRLGAWKDTVRMVKDFPVAGTGLNTYRDVMVLYQTENRHRPFFEAHNDYLQLAAEGGLLVGLPVVTLISLFILEVRRRFREAGDDELTYWLRVGAVIGLVAIACQELADFSLQMPGNAALFAVVAAIALHRSPRLRHRPRPPGRVPSPS